MNNKSQPVPNQLTAKRKYMDAYSNIIMDKLKAEKAFNSIADGKRYLTDEMYQVLLSSPVRITDDAYDNGIHPDFYGKGYTMVFLIPLTRITSFLPLLSTESAELVYRLYKTDTVDEYITKLRCDIDAIHNTCHISFELPMANDDVTDKLDCVILRALISYKFEQQNNRLYGSCSDKSWYCFWHKYLSQFTSGHADDLVQHPHIALSEAIHRDIVSNMPDKAFEEMMNEHATHSLFFNRFDQPASVREILINALSLTKLTEYEVDALSCILSQASYSTKYLVNHKLQKQTTAKTNNKPSDIMKLTPSDIYDMISDSVIGQTNAKRAAASLVYNHIRGHGRNIVMAGPTGCGKTEIWRSLSAQFPQIKIINGPSITAEGYKGGYKFSSIFTSEPEDIAEHIILVIDEADKMIEPQNNGTNDWTMLIQNELLKIMDHSENNTVTFISDGNKAGASSITIPTEHISVVLCGSFERMLKMKGLSESNMGFSEKQISERIYEADDCTEDDLVNHANMRIELAGRINQIVTLDGITLDVIKDIINHPTASPVHKLEKQLGISISLDENAKDKLAHYVADSKFGCRMMHSRLLKCIDNQMFNDPNQKKYDISKGLCDLLDECSM